MEGETTYTVEEAAAILGETPQRVVEMLATGELEGIPPDHRRHPGGLAETRTAWSNKGCVVEACVWAIAAGALRGPFQRTKV